MNRKEPNTELIQSRAPDIAAPGDGGRLPGMTKEYTGWDVYNNEAKKVDTELVNDWRDSLNSLLLFAAIFAAVLTAFIIESKKMLELDPTSVMMDVMIFYTNNMANGNHTVYTPSAFEPDSWAITVNCLFFASLSTSLVAGLASVVSLQWVADYDAAITRGGSSPEDRAKRRQFRYAGVVWWKMGELIAALPLLLYCSVVLFFGGLALWMWEVNHVVGFVVVGGAALAVLFYGLSTILAVVFVSAPFRTPLARWIHSSTLLSISFVHHIATALKIPAIPVWLEKQNLASAISRRREDQEVEKTPHMGITALVWLANELSVSQDSYDRLLLLAGELPKLKQEICSFPEFIEAPWYLIFDLLGWKNLKHTTDDHISPQDIDAFGVLAQCYRVPEIYDIISPTYSIQYVTDGSEVEYWSQYCDISGGQWLPKLIPNRPNSLFLLLRDIPLPCTDIPIDIEGTIRLSRWRNSPQMLHPPGEEFDPIIVLSTSYSSVIPQTTTHNTSSSESFINLGVCPKPDGLPLWFSKDDVLLYGVILRRMTSILGEKGTVPPRFLDALRWRFELQVVGAERINGVTCLYTPLEYREALSKSSSTFKSLHHAFTLLLARNLTAYEGDEIIFRAKEILTMLWAGELPWYGIWYNVSPTTSEAGMERFFDVNKALIMEWVENCERIPHIHEVLGHLASAQFSFPTIGPLWRVVPHREGDDPRLSRALFAFQRLINQGVTPQQHHQLVDLVCRDLSMGPPDVFKNYFTVGILGAINDLEDSCIRLLGQSYSEAVGDSFCLSSQDIGGPLRLSWSRIANHFLAHPEATSSPFLLRMQALLWPVVLNQSQLCSEARKDRKVLAHLEHIFECQIACSEHSNIEGHLLLHVLNASLECKVDADLTAYTKIPIRGRGINIELMLLILPDTRYIIPPESLHCDIHTECLSRILEIGKAVVGSQFSALSMLFELSRHIGKFYYKIYAEELAAISIGIMKALGLPKDPRAALIILGLISGIQKAKDKMNASDDLRAEWEKKAADREACVTVDKLKALLASMRIFGSQNIQRLSCSRTRESHSPAIGWLPMHVD